ncbi:AbrB/MazE/SpoVT family DNA-binding domain-containing protein [Desulfonema magnum]|uniref:Antidote-toxin recognition MazE domain-containing protein n=1 Tax=Desulfonema magnum TaxID=45655 RepID=A0A975BJ00_9BACT|nr:AbrB/MazE/SpoVT family DNA-binding domain-containing protein [Desulfonema magnum]QTA86584.1 Antidote-toxin recognition MazE domain-containing protein [Desulfonema magnum]
MRARIIKIGNSQGIRIPKPLLDQSGISTDVELEVEKHRIIIRPVPDVRAGWDNAFKQMAQNGDDSLESGADVISHSWDEDEWEW